MFTRHIPDFLSTVVCCICRGALITESEVIEHICDRCADTPLSIQITPAGHSCCDQHLAEVDDTQELNGFWPDVDPEDNRPA